MVDIAKLLAQRGAAVTIITTPGNALRFQATVTRAVQGGRDIRVVELNFPSEEVGLPKGCENFDMLSTHQLGGQFFAAAILLREPFETFLKDVEPPPSCMISDMCLPWTADVADKFHIPRIVFHGPSCFALLSMHTLFTSKVVDSGSSERVFVPGLPRKVEVSKAMVEGFVKPSASSMDPSVMKAFLEQILESEKKAFGVVANTFEELEPEFIEEYANVKGKKVWSIGPASQCNKDVLEKLERGNKASISENDCLNWLGSREPGSVLYVCLGSLARLATSQLIELGLALEESDLPFMWCVRYKTEEFDKWIIEENFEERTKGKGLIIWGWAPQVLILSHEAIGGFLTHCGWNSTLEGISAGIPLLTWPLFAEQFLNEALVVQILRTALSLGAERPIQFGDEEEVGVVVQKHDIKMAALELMDGGDEGTERRERARALGEMAKKAMEEGGSSHRNMNLLLQEITAQANV